MRTRVYHVDGDYGNFLYIEGDGFSDDGTLLTIESPFYPNWAIHKSDYSIAYSYVNSNQENIFQEIFIGYL